MLSVLVMSDPQWIRISDLCHRTISRHLQDYKRKVAEKLQISLTRCIFMVPIIDLSEFSNNWSKLPQEKNDVLLHFSSGPVSGHWLLTNKPRGVNRKCYRLTGDSLIGRLRWTSFCIICASSWPAGSRSTLKCTHVVLEKEMKTHEGIIHSINKVIKQTHEYSFD